MPSIQKSIENNTLKLFKRICNTLLQIGLILSVNTLHADTTRVSLDPVVAYFSPSKDSTVNFTIHNDYPNQTVTLGDIVLHGNTDQFTLKSNPCTGKTLEIGGQCRVAIRYHYLPE